MTRVRRVAKRIPEEVVQKASTVLVNSLLTLRSIDVTMAEILHHMQSEYEDDTHNIAALRGEVRKVVSDIMKTIPNEVLENELEFETPSSPRYGDEQAS